MAIQSLKFIRKKGLPDLVGIDLSQERLKIVHVRIVGLRRQVSNLVSCEARELSDEEMARFVTQTLADLKISDPRTFISVPLQAVITRNIDVPSRDPDEIWEIVNLQASRHTPYSRSEIIIDTLNLGLVKESYTRVLLIIVPKEAVARPIRVLEKAGLKLEKVFFPPEGICQACTKILNAEASAAPTAIVHMDEAFTSFIVIQKGKILFVRGIAIGADQLLEAREAYSDRFVDELQKSLESYVGEEAGPQPSSLLLTGVVAEIRDLDGLFSQTLRMPIKHQTYFNHFPISEAARQAASNSKQVSFFNIVAPLLLFDRMKVNLVSEEQKLSTQLEARGRQIVKTGMLAMILLGLVFASLGSKIYFKNAYLNRLADRYQPVLESAKELERVSAKTQVIKKYLASRGDSIEALAALYEALPDDLRLEDIRYEEGEKFSVKGTSSAMGSVFSFVTSLERSKNFKNVKTKYVTTRSDEGKDFVDFEINALIDRESALP